MAVIENNEGFKASQVSDSSSLSRSDYLLKSSLDEAEHITEGLPSGFTQEVMIRIRGLSTSQTNIAPVRRLD